MTRHRYVAGLGGFCRECGMREDRAIHIPDRCAECGGVDVHGAGCARAPYVSPSWELARERGGVKG